MIISCSSCNTRFRIDAKKVRGRRVKIRCSKCRNIFIVDGNIKKEFNKYKVLVAHESPKVCDFIKDILEDSGFNVIKAYDGKKALSIIERNSPHISILDVALPKMFGFEISELIKKDEKLKDIGVILISSIYDKNSYKRAPQSLYGADDYIEKHHLHDMLIPKIRNIIKDRDIKEKRLILRDEEREILKEETFLKVNKEEIEKAKRLARIIVSDIVLYNEELVDEGIKNGNFYELLEKDISEGRKYYEERVAPEIYEKTDYIREYFDKFIENKKKDMRLNE
jgi:predicted Zn finger-like uncharacterized protein